MISTLHSGLVSVTFRKLSVPEIVDLCVQTKLEGIEWGGDVHVPAGDIQRAKETRKLTLENGLKVAAYGSYYRLGTQAAPFEPVLETAQALGAPTIRVWAGTIDSQDANELYWESVIYEGKQIADLAATAGISISYEFHPQTLTNTDDSTLRLLQMIQRENINSYWQPAVGADSEANLSALSNLLPWLGNIHVFHWFPEYERHPLSVGTKDWDKYLSILCKSQRDRFLMLEFVQNDSVESFLQDAQTLRSWLDVSKNCP